MSGKEYKPKFSKPAQMMPDAVKLEAIRRDVMFTMGAERHGLKATSTNPLKQFFDRLAEFFAITKKDVDDYFKHMDQLTEADNLKREYGLHHVKPKGKKKA